MLFADRRKKTDDVAHFLVGQPHPRSRRSQGCSSCCNPKPTRKETTCPEEENLQPSRFAAVRSFRPFPQAQVRQAPKAEKKTFDIYVSDIETGEETLAITVFAVDQRQAIQIGQEAAPASPLMRKITYAAFTAVEIEK